MNSKKSPKLGTAKTVLQVVSVSVSSGKAQTDSDFNAIKVLQSAGFIGLKYQSKRTHAIVPGRNIVFLLEFDSSEVVKQKPFRLICVRPDSVRLIDSGYTIYISESGISGSTEVALRGGALSDWVLQCGPADICEVSAYKEIMAKGTQIPLESGREEGDEEEQQEEHQEELVTLPLSCVSEKAPEPEDQPLAEQILHIPLSECVCFQRQDNDPAFTGQPRKEFHENDLEKLVRTIKKHGQKVPALVRRIDTIPGKKWEIIAGERRWRALQRLEAPYLRAIEEKPATKKDQHMLALIENLFRVDPSPLEISNALQEQVNAGETQASLAESTSLSLTHVRKLLAIQLVHPELKPFLNFLTPVEDRIRLTEAAVLAKIDTQWQVEIWNKAKKEPSRRLVVNKIVELGKPYFVRQSGTKVRQDVTFTLCRTVSRRFEAMEKILLELNQLTPEQWRQCGTLRGYDLVTSDIGRVNEAVRILEEIKQRVFRARANLKISLVSADPSSPKQEVAA